jgi:hypothetical protein
MLDWNFVSCCGPVADHLTKPCSNTNDREDVIVVRDTTVEELHVQLDRHGLERSDQSRAEDDEEARAQQQLLDSSSALAPQVTSNGSSHFTSNCSHLDNGSSPQTVGHSAPESVETVDAISLEFVEDSKLGSLQCCGIRYEMRIGVIFPCAVIMITMLMSCGLAKAHGQISTIPLEMSKSANEAPSYWVFSTGLTIGGLLLFIMYPRPKEPVWKRRLAHTLLGMGVLGLGSLGWVCDGCHQLVHQILASLAFLSLLGLALLRNWRSPLIGLGFLCYVIKECIRQWYEGDYREELLGAGQWILMLCLLLSL